MRFAQSKDRGCRFFNVAECLVYLSNIKYQPMENITIPVPPYIARAFEKADVSVKRKAEVYINAWLNDFFSDKPANEQLFAIMKKGTAEAKANGLTAEQLDELLKDES